MEEILDAIRKQAIKQSLAIALGVVGNISQTFVVIEGEVIETRCLVSAVDKCFKVHYLGQLEYDPTVMHVWQFVQTYLYGISDNVPLAESTRDLISYLKARWTEHLSNVEYFRIFISTWNIYPLLASVLFYNNEQFILA